MLRTNYLAWIALVMITVAAGVTTWMAKRESQVQAIEPSRWEEQWKKVEEAQKKGLPKTAVAELQPIIDGAIAEKHYPEAIKAIGKKIALEGVIEGNHPEEKIIRLEAAIAAAPAEMKPVMHAILANWYWHYFQQNRWRFMQRTMTTEAAAGKDLKTWSLPRIFQEIDKQFTAALSNEAQLQAIPIGNYAALLQKGSIPDTYRPTLWDFLVFDALTFYTSPEQAAARPEDAWEPDADSPILSPIARFLKWNPETTDSDSRTLKAIRLYQKLLKFHENDPDKSALIDADLHRLQFAYNASFGPEKSGRYKAALQDYIAQWGDHELSAMARFRFATLLHEEGNAVEARRVAEAGAKAFPDSAGGISCHNLIQQIESPSLELQTERVWAEPWPTLGVKYRNLTRVHFRAYPVDYVARIGQQDAWRPEVLSEAERRELLKSAPALTWSVDLPPTQDYQERLEQTPVPKTLAPGFYFIFASPDADFTGKDQPIYAADVWVSSLALIVRNRDGGLGIEGFVLDAKSGEPIAGAKIRTWIRGNRGQFQPGPEGTSNDIGLFSIPGPKNASFLVVAQNGKDTLASGHDRYSHWNQPYHGQQQHAILFTDRAIYRPGQTIRYKGIALRFQQSDDQYEVIPKAKVKVQFLDPNGKEIAAAEAVSNDFGSFSGSFTAPRDRLSGPMSIQVSGRVHGSTGFQVEEYKRPQFFVELDAPKDPARLNSEVTVNGKAMAYTGVAIGGAKVRYRVVREVRYPSWFYTFCWWRIPPNPGQSQEIAHGFTISNADGSFPITFTAKPDRSVAEADEPIFTYTVTADVTDTTGETRSASRSVRVGYTAISANLSVPDWLDARQPVSLTLSTTNHDGVVQPAKGQVTIYEVKQPATVLRPELENYQAWQRFGRLGRGHAPEAKTNGPANNPDPANPLGWELGKAVATIPFETKTGSETVKATLPPGLYRAVVTTHDPFNKLVTSKTQFTVIDPESSAFSVKIPNYLNAPRWSLEPGEVFTAVWGTGYNRGRAYIEVEHRGQLLQQFWSDPGRTQVSIRQPVTEAMRGGFTVRISYVRENRAYIESRQVEVPWSNKQLHVKWERFVSKLEPGAKEHWTAVITGPDAKKAVAEMVATLYDASLDQFVPFSWPSQFHGFRHDHSIRSILFENFAKSIGHIEGNWPQNRKPVPALSYRHYPQEILANLWGYMYFGEAIADQANLAERAGAGPPRMMARMAPGAPPTAGAVAEAGLAAAPMMANDRGEAAKSSENQTAGSKPQAISPGKLDTVAARTNLAETAFFFPHLVSDEDGVVRLEFTMPEALTRWRFLGFAHDRALRAGLLEGETVTAKDLMVRPNPPRFLREGDVLEFTVKVSNQSDKPQTGVARLTLTDARTGQAITAALGVTVPEQTFEIPPQQSQTLAWRLTVPDGQGPVIYKVVGASNQLSDGEEGMLPVLSKRILVTESLPLPIRGAQTKNFQFRKLQESANSPTLRTQSLTVQMTSQPAWYAVMALPYLMEYPHECSEQVFSRMYANALARHIALKDPKIRRVFDQWKNTPALDSPLLKNQDLKAVMLEETPWLQDAIQESEARRNVGILFDDNRLNEELNRAFRKLADQQLANGAWPWFPGGPPNDYITLYITTGFGRLRHLGVSVDTTPAIKSLTRLDGFAQELYREAIRNGKKEESHLSPIIALYLYGRSFFLKDQPIAEQHKEAIDFWIAQAKKHWLKLADRQSQAHLALALARWGQKPAALNIVDSIRERSVSDEELGMYWRDQELSHWWYRAPIETQAVMIELFDEVANDPKAVEDCKVWLLKQKQTRNWKTTKATADAVYALLLRGSDLLSSDALVEVKLGGEAVTPVAVEAGTGFYEQKFLRSEVRPEMGAITVTKTDPGVAWGSVHWQYLEDISKVTAHEGTPLKLEKQVFKRVLTKTGPVLEPVKETVLVGDELVIRVILRTDRDMEYLHLKDHRGSGTEPVNVLSRYKYQDGLGYYESTRDTATDFFIDYLPKGTYVFEYPVRVQHKGKYPTGLASIQCMYAPEFNSHSASVMLEAR